MPMFASLGLSLGIKHATSSTNFYSSNVFEEEEDKLSVDEVESSSSVKNSSVGYGYIISIAYIQRAVKSGSL